MRPLDRPFWIAAYYEGKSLAWIAAAYGATVNRVRLALLAAGCPLRGFKQPAQELGRCERCGGPLLAGQRLLHRQGRPVMHQQHYRAENLGDLDKSLRSSGVVGESKKCPSLEVIDSLWVGGPRGRWGAA